MNTVVAFFSKYINNIYFLSVFTFSSILFFFTGIFFGLDFTDTFYHINLARIPPEGIFLYPIILSSILVHGLIDIFGSHLIYLRFINSLLFFIAVFIPFLFIKTEAPKINKLFYIGCIFFLIAPLNVNVLGYDTFSIIFNSLIFTTTILYIKKNNQGLLLVIAVLCAMTILIRLPNVFILPIISLIIFYNEKFLSSRSNLSHIKLLLLFLFFSVMGVFLSYYLYYKDWDLFKNASLGSISHDYKFLFYRYIRDAIKLIIFSSFITGGYFLFRNQLRKGRKILAFGLNFLLYIVFIILFLISGYSYTIFLTAIVLSLVVIHLYIETGKNRQSENLILITFFVFLFINAFGSNTGLLKTSFLFLLLPFVLCLVPIKYINYWRSILIILIPFAVFGKFYRTYEDSNILKLNNTIDLELLYPIRTNKERNIFLYEVDQKVKQLEKDNVSVYFYGDKSHIFHYLYPNSTLDIKAFTQPMENLIFLPKILDKVIDKTNVAVFLIHSYPGSNNDPKNLVELQLTEIGFKKIQEGPVEYLIKIGEDRKSQ